MAGAVSEISNFMNPIEKLSQMFNRFPGIGPRQAKRFVYFLLAENDGYIRELIETIGRLKREIGHCSICFRLSLNPGNKICELCRDETRDGSTLMVVAKDIDLENISRSGEFNGRYFVLGGLLPILEKNPEQKIRVRELANLIKNMTVKEPKFREIIIALSANIEGDYTSDYIRNYISPTSADNNLKITILGRGLSTGTELEYSDSDTIKNALKNRG